MCFVSSFLPVVFDDFYEWLAGHPNLVDLVNPEALMPQPVHSGDQREDQYKDNENHLVGLGKVLSIRHRDL